MTDAVVGWTGLAARGCGCGASPARPRDVSGQRGVTMVELIVAMLLLAIGLVGMAAAVPYAMYGVLAGGYQTTATLLAQQAIDLARSTGYDNLPTLKTGAASCSGGSGTFAAVTGFAGFTRCISVDVGTSTTTVTVVVRFRSGPTGGGPIYDTTMVALRAQ